MIRVVVVIRSSIVRMMHRSRGGFTVIQPLGVYINRFVQMMNGHLVVRAAQTTRHTAHARLVVHVRFHHVVVGTKGAFEAFGQFGFAFGNDLV